MTVSIPFLMRILPAEARRPGRVDFPGALLVALTVGFLVVWLNFTAWYWLAAFGAALVLFLIRIRTARDPFIAPSLFANLRFSAGVLVGFFLFSIVIGVLFLIPLMLSGIHGLGTSQIGLLLFPGAISSVVFGPLGGNLADRRGNSFVVTLGLGLLVTSLVAMAFLLGTNPLVIGGALVLTYVGFALFQTAMVNSVSQTLPSSETGIGMGVFNLVSIISGAVGTALVGKVLDGHWFEQRLLPVSATPASAAYSNLLLVFALVVIAGGLLYLAAYRKPAPGTVAAAMPETLPCPGGSLPLPTGVCPDLG